MTRRESVKIKKEVIPTIIGAGITERWYFSHIQSILDLRLKIRPRFFGHENIFSLEKRITQVLKDEGKAIVVFDADVSTWDDKEKTRLQKLRKKYSKNNNIILCDSLPSIEFWFLLHYQETNRFFGTSQAVIQELIKYVKGFEKDEKFLMNAKWVEEMTEKGKLDIAYKRSKNFGTSGESYSNLWKAFQNLLPERFHN